MSWLELGVLLRDVQSVAAILPLLDPVADLLIWQLGPSCIARHLGEGAALLGDAPQARGYYSTALEVAGRVGHRPEIAIIRLHLADLLLEHYPDERAATLDHLDFAFKEFEAMKMAPYLEKARALRARVQA